MALTAYFDESWDSHSSSPTTFVLAGFVSADERWTQVSEEWRAKLIADRINVYKAKLSSPRLIARSEQYYRIVEPHIYAGIYCIINIQELIQTVDSFSMLSDFFDPKKIKRKMVNPYHFAFKYLVSNLIQGKDKLGLLSPVDVVFDEKTEATTALAGYDFLKYTAPDDFKNKLGDRPTFKKDHETPPLQVADLYAGWLRKSYLEGVDLRRDYPFPWEIRNRFNAMHTFIGKKQIQDELEFLVSSKNKQSLVEYEGK